jgi:multidrug transporter EmrE-like cation transporter
VRTLALVEVPFAQIVSRRIFKQRMTHAEIAGMTLIVAGVVLLLNG